MKQKISIDPITRLEGHGKIDIFLNDEGNVEKAYFLVPELRGFEKFAQGRPAEEMPQITSRICGVCPTAHHMAAAKALDDLYKVDPPLPAKKIRELIYNIFMIEDHSLHFFYLAGPDFIVGPRASKADRNIIGVIGKAGLEIGKEIISVRRQLRELMTLAMGKVIHPVFGLPGGISKPVSKEDQQKFIDGADSALKFARFALDLFKEIVLKNQENLDYVISEYFTHETYYMGLVDDSNRINFYEGNLRVVDPQGREFLKFHPGDYLSHIAEHVEPWTYVRFSFLKDIGWKGFNDGMDSGIFAVAPLARLNAADGMATGSAQKEYEYFYSILGGKPVHYTLANNWARLIEIMYAAERMSELANDPDIVDPNVRTIPTEIPSEGIGVVEAPRGTLIHHYKTDEKGLTQGANLIVATQNNSARIALSIDKAARGFITGGNVDDGILNTVEMAFRAYDPCLGCATHSINGHMNLKLRIFDSGNRLIDEIYRGG
jgi:F420-non-reducing hydrogenase large subunit